ncbi:NEDD4-binding protein 3-A [Xenopus laevis]|uniref:NEDD4-binding protein 3-A n=2 Tax=Xenopus laevis TaxID=8355 RepID=N4B3A_XENLA|nr:NEDD4-binding protein 3-A [Xenopus laevis]A0A1L8GXY6.1 RecName: Full=NEDD4-binding protein 3-A [Xenopus laevis]OCT88708.1 hypothetical protein XELAEV_18017338mg [Xenopus laevis]
MAAAQTFNSNCDPGNFHKLQSFPSESVTYTCKMGSVSSLIDKQDFPHDGFNLDFKPFPEPNCKRGLHQKELLSYLNITKKEVKSNKKFHSGLGFRREHSVEGGENDYPVFYHKDHRGTEFSKSSLPERGHLDKSRFGPSALRSNVKAFMSIQSLYQSGNKLSKSNGSLNTMSCVSSPPCRGPLQPSNSHSNNQSESGNDEEDDSLSDSRQNSINSLNSYSPGFSVARGQISASLGHINHIGGSLDQASRGTRDTMAGEKGTLSCRSMATLSRLQCSGEPPPPYEYSQSVEDVARQLEERLHEKGMEARQLRRNASDNDDPFTKVFEDKRRLWMEELDELKQMYMSKLQQISQQALRSQRALQLQLYKVQQEKKRLQEELNSLRGESEELRQKQSQSDNSGPKLEDSKWEISQKAGEISLLKQQLRDSQAEINQKLGEVVSLKSQLREAKVLVKEKEKESAELSTRLQALENAKSQAPVDLPRDNSDTIDLERLRAELMLERRQNEAQMLTFETERKVWKEEKDKVLRYQKEIQSSYREMYHRNQVLERQVLELRQGVGQSPSSPAIWMDTVET